MTAAVIWGVVAGAVSFGISELLLKLWKKHPALDFWKVCLLGVIARGAYVLGMLTFVVVTGWVETAPFTMALAAVYLAAQVFEAFRYRSAEEEIFTPALPGHGGSLRALRGRRRKRRLLS